MSRSVEAAEAQARASVDDLEVVTQTMEADLAQDYFNLRSFDAQDEILARNVKLYREQVTLTEKQYKSGIVSKTDVLQAQTLLDSTVVQEIDFRRQRRGLEHATSPSCSAGRPPSSPSTQNRSTPFAAARPARAACRPPPPPARRR